MWPKIWIIPIQIQITELSLLCNQMIKLKTRALHKLTATNLMCKLSNWARLKIKNQKFPYQMSLIQVNRSQISNTERARKLLTFPKLAMLTRNRKFKILRRVVKRVPREFAIKMLGRRADREKQEVHSLNQESRLMSRVELEVTMKPKEMDWPWLLTVILICNLIFKSSHRWLEPISRRKVIPFSRKMMFKIWQIQIGPKQIQTLLWSRLGVQVRPTMSRIHLWRIANNQAANWVVPNKDSRKLLQFSSHALEVQKPQIQFKLS